MLVKARVRDLGSRLHTPPNFYLPIPPLGGGGGRRGVAALQR